MEWIKQLLIRLYNKSFTVLLIFMSRSSPWIFFNYIIDIKRALVLPYYIDLLVLYHMYKLTKKELKSCGNTAIKSLRKLWSIYKCVGEQKTSFDSIHSNWFKQLTLLRYCNWLSYIDNGLYQYIRKWDVCTMCLSRKRRSRGAACTAISLVVECKFNTGMSFQGPLKLSPHHWLFE